MPKSKLNIIAFLILSSLFSTLCSAADDSCGCLTSVDNSGLQLSTDGQVFCYGIATGSAGTLDSIVFWAKDYDSDGDDTLYVMVYDTLTGGDIDALKDRSDDSIIITGSPAGWTRYSLPLEAGSVASGEFVYVCLWLKGIASSVRIDICNDNDYATNIREYYTDAPELEDPATGVTSDTTNYAPHVLLYWTTAAAGSSSKKIGAGKLGAGKW